MSLDPRLFKNIALYKQLGEPSASLLVEQWAKQTFAIWSFFFGIVGVIGAQQSGETLAPQGPHTLVWD